MSDMHELDQDSWDLAHEWADVAHQMMAEGLAASDYDKIARATALLNKAIATLPQDSP
jgi:hypothetical protein